MLKSTLSRRCILRTCVLCEHLVRICNGNGYLLVAIMFQYLFLFQRHTQERQVSKKAASDRTVACGRLIGGGLDAHHLLTLPRRSLEDCQIQTSP